MSIEALTVNSPPVRGLSPGPRLTSPPAIEARPRFASTKSLLDSKVSIPQLNLKQELPKPKLNLNPRPEFRSVIKIDVPKLEFSQSAGAERKTPAVNLEPLKPRPQVAVVSFKPEFPVRKVDQNVAFKRETQPREVISPERPLKEKISQGEIYNCFVSTDKFRSSDESEVRFQIFEDQLTKRLKTSAEVYKVVRVDFGKLGEKVVKDRLSDFRTVISNPVKSEIVSVPKVIPPAENKRPEISRPQPDVPVRDRSEIKPVIKTITFNQNTERIGRVVATEIPEKLPVKEAAPLISESAEVSSVIVPKVEVKIPEEPKPQLRETPLVVKQERPIGEAPVVRTKIKQVRLSEIVNTEPSVEKVEVNQAKVEIKNESLVQEQVKSVENPVRQAEIQQARQVLTAFKTAGITIPEVKVWVENGLVEKEIAIEEVLGEQEAIDEPEKEKTDPLSEEVLIEVRRLLKQRQEQLKYVVDEDVLKARQIVFERAVKEAAASSEDGIFNGWMIASRLPSETADLRSAINKEGPDGSFIDGVNDISKIGSVKTVSEGIGVVSRINILKPPVTVEKFGIRVNWQDIQRVINKLLKRQVASEPSSV